MDTPVAIILIIIALFLLWQIFVFTKSKMSVGKIIPLENLDAHISDKIRGKTGLIYFFSKSCANCTKQTLIIEKVKKEYDNIVSIDTSKFTSTAKKFNVAATPSIIFFSGNKIQGYYVGVKNESFILKELQKLLQC